jgi:two-component system, response regulator / RNA-binding antiterminator
MVVPTLSWVLRFRIAKRHVAVHHKSMQTVDLVILVIDESVERAHLIDRALREAGHHRVVVVSQFTGLVRRIEELAPDVIVMDLGNPNRDFLEHMFRLSKAVQKPVAMFVDQSSEQSMLDAVEAGVSAYVVDGLKQERVKAILDLAIMRFRAFEKLRRERDDALLALDERRSIDRAKGIVMANRGVGEAEAHKILRDAAMSQGRRVGQIAEGIVAAQTILKGKQP